MLVLNVESFAKKFIANGTADDRAFVRQTNPLVVLKKIYQLTKKRHIGALRLFQKMELAVDGVYGAYSVMRQLAAEGDTASVEYLIEEFNGNMNWAVAGYAYANNIAAVNDLLQRGASLDHAVRGYAIGRHINEVNDLLSRGASIDWAVEGYAEGGAIYAVNDLLGKDASIDCAIIGYACARNTAQVNQLLTQGARLNAAVNGYARGGYTAEVNELLQEGASLDVAVSAYARAGHIQKVNALLKLGASKDCAVTGYAFGGHIWQVNKLLRDGADQNAAVTGYISGRYFREVNKLLASGASYGHAVYKYAVAGCIKEVNALLQMHAVLDFAVSGYAFGGHVEAVNDLLDNRGASRDTAVRYYALGKHVKAVNDLLEGHPNLDEAVYGYAVRGHVSLVNDLLARGASLDIAVYGYATGKFTNEVNELLRRGATKSEAISGYDLGGHMRPEKALYLMSHADDVDLRRLLLAGFNRRYSYQVFSGVFDQAGIVNKLMHTHAVSFRQASALVAMQDKQNVWLVQGLRWIVKEKQLPATVFLKITAHFLDLTQSAMQRVLILQYRKLYQNCRDHLIAKQLPWQSMQIHHRYAFATEWFNQLRQHAALDMEPYLAGEHGFMGGDLFDSDMLFTNFLATRVLTNPLKYDERIQRLCELTQKRDALGLRELAKQGVFVNATYGIYTVVEALAHQGDKASVEYLLQNFQASPNAAVLGYARGGHIKEVKQLLRQGAGINWAVKGYAAGGYVKEVNALLAQGADKRWAVHGYAYGGYVNAVDDLLAQGVSRDDAVFGYALGGYIDKVNKELALGACRKCAVYGYAHNGYFAEVKALLPANQDEFHDFVIWGYASGGYYPQVEAQLLQGGLSMAAITCYASSGHLKQVNEQLTSDDYREAALCGYASVGDFAKISDLLQQNALVSSRSMALQECIASGQMYAANALFAMSLTTDLQFRKILLDEFKKRYPDKNMEAVCKKAEQISKMMLDHALHYRQALLLVSMPLPERSLVLAMMDDTSIDYRSMLVALASMQLPQKIWILQGVKLVSNGQLTADMFLNITACVLGFNIRTTDRVMFLQYNQFFKNSTNQLIAKHMHKPGLTPEDYFLRGNQINQRYNTATTMFFSQNESKNPVIRAITTISPKDE